ncbi:HAMP domain-containing sensor histidine kinase [Ferdinandcohnia quinoae]|uniref:Heme sensor protein HssS n=1 Tax=Fredinandcohnia quinoae TaxID=2918902 RepID=A0AAW5E8D7_9BACI|nr:HAMP domain-containing sensor histidine kinase [Fredinandcohnia sp. SECRCQ15]MCH1626286.1 HAMP domain-containing histidine kinase [Fredinandcohnia sp. SECRCQ15]
MRSLYSKFAITTIAIMLMSSLISFFLSNYYYQHSLKAENDQKMTNMVLEISRFIESQEIIKLDDYLNNIGKIGYQIYLVDENGNKQFFGAKFREVNLTSKVVNEVLSGNIYHGIASFPHKTFVTGFFANELKNTVGVPFQFQNKTYALFLRPDIKLLFSEMHILFGWIVVGIVALSIIFVLVSTKYLVNPISKLTKATTTISEGKYGIKLNIHRKDEIGQLATSFTKMAGKLERVDDMRKEFISNISHDIQSPLSNIKGYITKFQEEKLTVDEQRYLIEVVNSEVNRLSNLTRQLLLLSSIENKKEILETKRINIGEQIKSLIQQQMWKLNEKGIMISYSLPDTYVYGDPSLLYSVWENLLTNSIKYNKVNGEIDITVKGEVSHVFIEFRDTGIGMDEIELERIYDRFYRADASRNRSVEGTGLGLAIVKSALNIHNGEIKVNSQKEKGSKFTVILPRE